MRIQQSWLSIQGTEEKGKTATGSSAAGHGHAFGLAI